RGVSHYQRAVPVGRRFAEGQRDRPGALRQDRPTCHRWAITKEPRTGVRRLVLGRVPSGWCLVLGGEMRRTKIVATIGPACHSSDVIERLLDAGMDVARLNFS